MIFARIQLKRSILSDIGHFVSERIVGLLSKPIVIVVYSYVDFIRQLFAVSSNSEGIVLIL